MTIESDRCTPLPSTCVVHYVQDPHHDLVFDSLASPMHFQPHLIMWLFSPNQTPKWPVRALPWDRICACANPKLPHEFWPGTWSGTEQSDRESTRAGTRADAINPDGKSSLLTRYTDKMCCQFVSKQSYMHTGYAGYAPATENGIPTGVAMAPRLMPGTEPNLGPRLALARGGPPSPSSRVQQSAARRIGTRVGTAGRRGKLTRAVLATGGTVPGAVPVSGW